jgi:hypothetical protein
MASAAVMRDLLRPLRTSVKHGEPNPLASRLGSVHVDEVLVRLHSKSSAVVNEDRGVWIILWASEGQAPLFDLHGEQSQRIRGFNMSGLLAVTFTNDFAPVPHGEALKTQLLNPTPLGVLAVTQRRLKRTHDFSSMKRRRCAMPRPVAKPASP